MEEITGYEFESTNKLPNDLFSGRLPLEQALQTLRARLLDLSSRNRLLDYKHPKRRSIQFVDEPNLNLVFDRLIDGNRRARRTELGSRDHTHGAGRVGREPGGAAAVSGHAIQQLDQHVGSCWRAFRRPRFGN